MKILLTILFVIICQDIFCQTNSYTAYWKVKPNSGITSFSIQRSSDNANWMTAVIISASKDTSYKADFNAFSNNFIRVMATTKDTVWSSPVIQVTAILPVVFSKVSIRKITYLKK